MKIFIIHWLDGTASGARGKDIADALVNSGFSKGAVKAIDYYEEKK